MTSKPNLMFYSDQEVASFKEAGIDETYWTNEGHWSQINESTESIKIAKVINGYTVVTNMIISSSALSELLKYK